MAADLLSSAGVVTIDLNANTSDFYRMATTENITSWVISGDEDGDGFLLKVTRNTGHTISWTGLIDVWTNGVPTLLEGESIYFPVVRDSGNWIGDSVNITSTDPALLTQSITQSTSSALTIDADNGHRVEVTLDAAVLSFTLNNLADGDELDVIFLANAGNRWVDFTGISVPFWQTNPGNYQITTGNVFRVKFVRTHGTTHLMEYGEAPTADPSTTSQTIAHSVLGGITIDADSGHSIEVTLTANINAAHTINNLALDDVLAVYYQASGASRDVDFTSATAADGLTNPGNVTIAQNGVYRATWIRAFGVTYLLDAELLA